MYGHAGTHDGGLDMSVWVFHGHLFASNLLVSGTLASVDVVVSDCRNRHVRIVGSTECCSSSIGSGYHGK